MNRKPIPFLLLATLTALIVPTIVKAADDCCDMKAGAVFLMTNQPENAIRMFNRSADGGLTLIGDFPTEGAGNAAMSGSPLDPLGSENSLILNQDNHLLFAVNAGSNEISVMEVGPNRLTLISKVASGGQTPISLTLHRDLLYVLNSGGAPNITGFVLHSGNLSPLPGSTRPLSGGTAAQPAEVSFNPSGDVLIVTEKQTNTIDTYTVEDGIATGPVPHASAGMTPFGFSFARQGFLIVSEAFGGMPGRAATSSYRVSDAGDVKVISPSVRDFQTAACWVVIAKDRFAYVTNTGSNVISGYSVSSDGVLTLLNPDGVTASTGANPIDMALSNNGRFLYVHLAGARSITGYRIDANGGLTQVASIGGLPLGAQGIAAK